MGDVVARVGAHNNHIEQELGQPESGVNVHTHTRGVVTGVLADDPAVADHTHTNGTRGDVVMVTPHTHDGTGILMSR